MYNQTGENGRRVKTPETCSLAIDWGSLDSRMNCSRFKIKSSAADESDKKIDILKITKSRAISIAAFRV